MKKRPLSIQLIALIFLLAPIFNILEIAYFNRWPLSGPRSVFLHLDHFEWVVLALYPIVAFGIWSVSRVGYVLCIVFAAFIILHNTYVMLVQKPAHSLYVILLFQVCTFGVVGFFLQKHVIAPYFNPKLKWWENPPRYKTNLRAQLHKGQSLMECVLLDISEGGCFISLKKKLKLEDTVHLHISLENARLTAPSTVVWLKAKGEGGYGLTFNTLERSDEENLAKILKILRKNQKKSIAQKGKNSDSIQPA